MKRTVAFVCATLSLGLGVWANAKWYDVALLQPVVAGGVELKPGDYKLSVENDKAVLHKGKIASENPVKVEMAEQKYPATSMVLVNADGKLRIREIHLGGTKTKLVFTDSQP